MRILSIDPGAKRCGYAVLETKDSSPPTLIKWGILGLDRETVPYQKYKSSLIKLFTFAAQGLFDTYKPDEIVLEIVPIKGFHDPSQSFLASTVATTFMSVATINNIPFEQVSAVAVKKKLIGKGKVTKVAIRNKVLELYPEISDYLKENKQVFDATDAIAIGHVSLK